MRRWRIGAAVVLASGLVLMTSAVGEAATISAGSSLSFGGAWKPVGASGIVGATGVDVLGDVVSVSCALSSSCTGDYAVVTGSVTATYHDFSFAPLGPPAGGPVSPLWTFDFGGKTYSFDLETVVVTEQSSTVLGLSGTGTLSITGSDPTFGEWSFSGDTTKTVGVFAFSSTSTSVPDGGSTLALLGLGLVGMTVIRRRILA